ncbi:MAG: PP2C family protein-serine/threonine phosphatase [Eubacterium sp.]|nr:PP2C family protein-serine/threonine phosphatase [Eubacterium sp.]
MLKNLGKLHNFLIDRILKNPKVIFGAFIYVLILSVAGFALQMIRGFDGMDPTWTFSTGIESIGIFICAIIYYSCMRSMDVDEPDEKMVVFISMLIPCASALFLDLCAWLVQSNPDTIVLNILSNGLLHICYYMIGYMFWIYVYKMLRYRSRLLTLTNAAFNIGFIVVMIICIADFFLPIFFSVDSSGEYKREAFYVFKPFLYFILVPGLIELCIKSKEPIQKIITITSVIYLPFLAEFLTNVKFGISTKPGAIMLAILINFGIVIADRGKDYAKTKNELEIASQIQTGLLPSIFPPFPDRTDFDIYAQTVPAREVGGDFYDFFMIDNRHFAILIADVSDKGMGAALFMTISKSLIKTRAQMGGTPSEIVTFVDEKIEEDNQAGMFVTLWFGIIDLETGHVDVCNAGHDYPAIMKMGKDFTIEKTEHGPAVGLLPGMTFPGTSFDLMPGDRIFLYTDGIVEAKAPNSDRFGTERMLKVLNDNKESDNKALIDAVKEAANKFSDTEPQFDDMTMLSFTYKGRKNY